MQFSIPADTIKALLLAAPKVDPRYYLKGILFDVRSTDAVAVTTDGHIMVAVPLTIEDGETVPVGQYIVPREALDSIKASKLYNLSFTFDAVARTVTIGNGGASTTSKLIDGTFPEWRRVVPRKVTGTVSQFQAEYIAAFGKIHKLLGGKFSPIILHNGDGNGAGGPARVVLAGDAVGVMMPMRYDPQPLENPLWMGATLESAALVAA